MMKKIKELSRKELEGKKVLARFDLNVPINGGRVADDFRIKKSLPTLNWLVHHKAKIILTSHLEDVYSKEGGASSLRPVYEYLKDFVELKFAESVEDAALMIEKEENGGIILLENLRFNPGEKKNDLEFARKLADMADLYVNEAFSVSHRSHASIIGVPSLLPSYAGPLFTSEVENLSKALSPVRPFVFILGGAKFETKMPLIEKYLEIADNVVVAGALANDFFKAKGYEIGESTVYGQFDISHLVDHPKIILPIDVVVWTNEGIKVKKPNEVTRAEKIEDIGPDSLDMLTPFLEGAKFLLWNGPLGNYEKGFKDNTVKFAEMISRSPAFSIVGGGDTTAVISGLDFQDKFGFVSTGGGAMLEFLEKGTLPGIEALNKDK
jgi:phosphoglycerate kinase